MIDEEEEEEGGCSSIEYILMRGKIGDHHRTLVTQTILISVLPRAVHCHEFPFLFLFPSSSFVVAFGLHAVVCTII